MPQIDQSIIRQRQGLKARKRYKGGKPDLRVSHSVKIADDFEHTKNVMDYFVESSWFQDQTTLASGNYRDIYILYDAYNTIIPEEQFHYVVNPLNSSRQDRASFPARIRPYSIIRPNIDLLFGEYDRRPFNYTVVVTSNDVVSKVEKEIHEAVVSSLEQQFINSLNQQGFPTGQQSQEAEMPADIKAKKQGNFKDARANRAQNVINRAKHELYLDQEWRRGFKDWVIAGEVYSYRGVRKKDMFYERVSPLDIDYDKSPDNEFVEDGSWACRRKYLSPSDINTMFWDELSEYEIDRIEEMDSTLPFTSTYHNTLFGNTYRTEEDLRRTKIPVYHVNFKYYTKVGILTFDDEFGVEQEIEVAENYKVDRSRGEKIEWFWIPETWHGWRLDLNYTDSVAGSHEGSVYLGMERVEEQRGLMNNMAYCKLNYNGMRYSDTHSRNISIVEMGVPYQVLHQILHYKMELTIAKSKGKIALLDINTIPNKEGWDEEKFFYYAEAMGFGLIDRSQLGTDKTWNQYQVLDMGLYDHIQNLIGVMEFVRNEWDELVGITRQRKGQTTASETATGVNTAKYQSAIISERAFSRFEEFLQRELAAIIDYSKFSNIASEKEPFYRDDMTIELLNVTAAEYMEAEYGIYVSNNSQDVEDLEMLRQLIPNLSSQNTDPTMLMEMIKARNVSKLKGILAETQAKEMEMAAASEDSAAKIEERKIEIQKEYKSIEFEFDNILQDNKYDREEDLQHIKGQYQLADTDSPGDLESLSPADAEKNLLERDKILQDSQSKRADRDVEREKIRKDSETKKYVSDNQLKIAKENKTQHELKAKSGGKG